MEPAKIKEWRNKDLWSEKELQELCCGLNPNGARPDTNELNQAAEAIKRAILSKRLPCKCPSDATQADRLYGHARFFTPADAIKWAAPKFSEFPFRADETCEGEQPLGTREKETLLKLVICMAMKGYTYNPNSERNSAIGEIESDLKGLGIPVTDDTIRKWLQKAADTVLPANTRKT